MRMSPSNMVDIWPCKHTRDTKASGRKCTCSHISIPTTEEDVSLRQTWYNLWNSSARFIVTRANMHVVSETLIVEQWAKIMLNTQIVFKNHGCVSEGNKKWHEDDYQSENISIMVHTATNIWEKVLITKTTLIIDKRLVVTSPTQKKPSLNNANCTFCV